MKTKTKKTLCLCAALCLCLSAFACDKIEHNVIEPATQSETETSKVTQSTTVPPQVTTAAVTTTTAPPAPVVFNSHFFAVGDNLIHSSIYRQAAARATDGGYDFDFAYENTAPYIPQSGIRFINQETLVCNDMFEPSTFPYFNSPTQLGQKMLDMGFNAFCSSNNHCLDKGTNGVLYALEYWSDKDCAYFGSYADTDDLNNIRTRTEDGITYGFLGFTEHTNGNYIAYDADIRVVYTRDTELMKQQIEAADAVSDVVVVGVHWGVEGSNTVTDAQRTLAQQFADWGADIIVGTHPHTIQSIEWLDTDDGSDAIVFYSLGNFISAQDYAKSMVGLAVDFDLTYDSQTDTLDIYNVGAMPIVDHYEGSYKNVRNYMFCDYTDELASKHGLGISREYVKNLAQEVIPSEFLVLDGFV